MRVVPVRSGHIAGSDDAAFGRHRRFSGGGFPQRLWKCCRKACGQAGFAACSSVTCLALIRKQAVGEVCSAACAAAHGRGFPQQLCVSAVQACGQLQPAPLPTITCPGLAIFCAVPASSPQPLWSTRGKACGQVDYLSEWKGACDGVGKNCTAVRFRASPEPATTRCRRECFRWRWRRARRWGSEALESPAMPQPAR